MYKIFYVLPLIIISFIFFVNLFFKRQRGTILLESSLFVLGFYSLFLLISFKGNIEPDYYNYKLLFDNGPTLSELNSYTLSQAQLIINGIEPGIILLNSIIKFFGGSYQYSIILINIFNFILILYIAKFFEPKFRYLIITTLCFIFFQGMFIQVRFTLSCLLAYVSFLNFIKSKFFHAAICFIIAFLFHTIAIFSFVLILVWLYRNYLYKKIKFLFLIIIPFVFVDPTPVIQFIVDNLSSRYLYYINLYDGITASQFPFFWRLIVNIILITIIFYREPELFNNQADLNKFLLIICLLNVLSWAIGYKFPILYRVSWFFDLGYLFYPIIYSQSKYVIKKFIFIIIFMIFLYMRVLNGLDSFDVYYFDFV
ncbi:EpsG family protein [Providencia rettgeri]|uniref:EpsG family protein n=2 Tax=Morganellaceae TaxID=1903414 RepID=UPI001CFE4273|nr:EpsG family protein [Providencia rettgeri]MCB4855698.1 EpsG family protein [Providencia rettgeri]